MPRIRSIKPETPTDERLARVSREARLTFIYTWTQADDDGLLRANPRQLLADLYPYDEDVDENRLLGWVEECVVAGMLRWRETRDGAPLLEIVNFSRHQKIDNRSKAFLANQLAPLSENGREPPPIPRETLARTSREESGVGSQESGSYVKAADAADTLFDRFWAAYPKRAGSNPQKAARRKWDGRIKAKVDPEVMIAGAERYRRFCEATAKVGTEYVKQAQFWLSPSFEGWSQPWDTPAEPMSSMGFGDEDFFSASRDG